MKAWPVLGIVFIQSFLLVIHWFLYWTWVSFCGVPGGMAGVALKAALLALGCSFVVGALLSFFFAGWLVTAIYRVAAFWLGLLNYIFWGACLSWLAWGLMKPGHVGGEGMETRQGIAWVCLGLSIAVSVFGILNARWVRVRRVAVELRNLPAAWRGRTALLASDLHLGHVNGIGFSRRMAALMTRLKPDVVFLAGDFFDGTKVDPGLLASPLKGVVPPFGVFFATGNHDEFGDTPRYLAALRGAGVRVLANEKVVVEGLQILGVPYHDTTYPMRMRAVLEAMEIDRGTASILINHVPNRLPIVEQAGVSLQVSGHTHGGQLAPFTWLTRRVFGKFTYGLHSFGELQVFTSYGAGTWGPPMRVGTRAEVVVIRFV